MDTPLILLSILAFGFAATRLERFVLGDRVRLLAGMEYLLLGVICGPFALAVLGPGQVAGLEPLISIINGFVGFLAGLPLMMRGERAFRGPDVRFAVLTGAIAALLISIAGCAALSALPDIPLEPLRPFVISAATLGFGAVVASRWTVVRVVAERRADGPVARALPTASIVLRTFGIVGFGVVMAAHRALSTGDGALIHTLSWTGISVVGGVLSGVIFHTFVGAENKPDKLFVAVIGITGLASGIAHALAVSPIFIGLVAGMTVARFSPGAAHLNSALERFQRPAFVVLLILAGADWIPVPWLWWTIPVGFVFLRAVALRLGAAVASRTHSELRGRVPGLGSAFLHQSVIVAAIAVNLKMVEPHPAARIVMTALLLSAVLNPLWASRFAVRVLQNAGETGRRPADADAPDGPDLGAEGQVL